MALSDDGFGRRPEAYFTRSPGWGRTDPELRIGSVAASGLYFLIGIETSRESSYTVTGYWFRPVVENPVT